MVPVAAAAVGLVAVNVPTSRDPATPRLDVVGLGLSVIGLGALVYTIIEAPGRGWTAPATLAGFAFAAAIASVFVAWERRTEAPMLDVGLFTNLRFSAASGSVTVAFFALLGFIFMITMYFQLIHGWSPLSTGVRLLPVAISLGAASALGPNLAVRVGNKVVVASGLALMAVGLLWISRSSADTTYLEMIGQMLVTAGGMGLATAPATEAIMGVVPKEKAGVGSAVNDATRELGGTLGVAVIGSVFTSLYVHDIARSRAAAVLSPGLVGAAKESIGQALITARSLASTNPAGARLLANTANHAFFSGFSAGCLLAAGVALAGAVFAAVFLPARPADLDLDAAELPVASPVPALAALDASYPFTHAGSNETAS